MCQFYRTSKFIFDSCYYVFAGIDSWMNAQTKLNWCPTFEVDVNGKWCHKGTFTLFPLLNHNGVVGWLWYLSEFMIFIRIVDFCILFPTHGSCRTHRVGFQPMSSKNPEFHHSILCQPMACLLPWGCVILTAHGGWLGTTMYTDWSRIKLENCTIWQFCYLKKKWYHDFYRFLG